MTCKLCLRDRDLKQSHIFPELLYTTLYDDKHRALQFSSSAVRPRYMQKGVRESLLCLDCEKHLDTTYENYFARFWYQTAPLPNPSNRGPYELCGYEYERFKLFHLSILWRASVAAGSAFKHANLGPHEPRLREMVLNVDAGPPEEYPVFASILTLPDTKAPCDGIVMPPIFVRGDGHRLYAMIYGGCVWHVAVGAKRIGPPLTRGMLRPNGLVLPVWDIDRFKPAADFFRTSEAIKAYSAKGAQQ